MNPIVVALPLLVGQVSSPELSAALNAVAEGAEVQVSRTVAAQAALAVNRRPDMGSAQLEQHLQVATRGGALDALVAPVARLVAADGQGLEPALRVAGVFRAAERRQLLASLKPAAAGRQRLLTACFDEDEQVARGALVVVAGQAPAPVVVDLLRELLPDEELAAYTELALEVIATRGPSTELFEALLGAARSEEAPLPVALHAPVARVLAAFIDRDPRLGRRLLDAVRDQPTPALLEALVATPLELCDEASAAVVQLVGLLSEDLAQASHHEALLLAAALRAGGDLRAGELLPVLPDLCLPTAPTPVRAAALRALGDLGARDVSIIDTLLTYVGEPEPIGSAAFHSLRQRSGAKLPHRPILWQDWRKRTTLVEMTAEEHEQRLRKERTNRHSQRMLAVERTTPVAARPAR